LDIAQIVLKQTLPAVVLLYSWFEERGWANISIVNDGCSHHESGGNHGDSGSSNNYPKATLTVLKLHVRWFAVEHCEVTSRASQTSIVGRWVRKDRALILVI